ncbi:transcriptional coactivator/pterin dehydratase [Delphinella strobiligena]|nr:transcriptional coactivator/pterin dehydratase [Delphinella strobiligena]
MHSLRSRLPLLHLRPKPTSQQSPLIMTSCAMSSSSSSPLSTKISCAKGEDETKLADEALALTVEGGGKWRLTGDGRGLERTFLFGGFGATWDFMNKVAAECKTTRHHPEWSNVYNKTHILWTTHKPQGLSSKDLQMARFCDGAAREYGELGGGGEEL